MPPRSDRGCLEDHTIKYKCMLIFFVMSFSGCRGSSVAGSDMACGGSGAIGARCWGYSLRSFGESERVLTIHV